MFAVPWRNRGLNNSQMFFVEAVLGDTVLAAISMYVDVAWSLAKQGLEQFAWIWM